MAKNKDNIFDLNKLKKEQQKGGGQQSPPNTQLSKKDILDSPDIQCQRCGGELFLPAMRFKRISKLLTGAERDQRIPLQTMVCANCGMELDQGISNKDKKQTDSDENRSNDTPDTAFDEEE